MKNNKFARKVPYREQFARLLVVCEGEVTEPLYLNEIRHAWRSRIIIELDKGAGVPISVVERATEKKNQTGKKLKAKNDTDEAFDEVWCVFDTDDHPKVAEARKLAQDRGFRVAFSNPCFELWLLLHFQDQTAYIDRVKLRSRCRGHIPDYEKKIPVDKIMSGYDEALSRARALTKWQKERDSEFENPYTDVYLLTERIREGAKTQG